jgi:tRNA threonylcarbamoyladenosine biosynthesis protein TsaB
MPSLRQLLVTHAPLLLIDAASTRVQVGLLGASGPARWAALDGEAGVAVFTGIAQLGVDPAAVGAFVFCEGPGSILGIRTAAMAIRTWQTLAPRPAFAYGSLALVAAALGRDDVAIVADARRDSWHFQKLGGPLRRLPTAELAGELIMPENFRHWTPLPAGLQRTPYDVAALLAAGPDAPLFRETDAPDAFLHEDPSYATWTPQIHRAPSP